MPTKKQLEKILNEELYSENWQTSSFITKNKTKITTKLIVFTPLLAANFLAEANWHDLDKINVFLQKNISNYSTWNYHLRDNKQTYPDDLDSTVIANNIRLKFDQRSQEIIVADLISQLISQEIRPGGPYRTWLFNDNDINWGKDVDLVVNYRIMKLLQQFNVNLPSLNTWLHKQSKLKKSSPYYPLIESQLVWLQFDPNPTISNLSPTNLYEVARLISMALNVPNNHVFLPALQPYYKKLLNVKKTSLKAFPSFLDNIKKDYECWVGSRFLTLCACYHAIHCYEEAIRIQTIRKQQLSTKQKLISAVHKELSVLPKQLYKFCDLACQKLLGDGNSPALCFLPSSTTQILNITPELWTSLATATIFGWAGYGLHDHVIDENKLNTTQIVSSRTLTLLSFSIFLEISKFAKKNWFKNWLTQTYLRMESTYLFDSQHSQTKKPTIGWEQHIFNRSSGLLVAPAVLQLAINSKTTNFNDLIAVGKPLIIAKQLMDDLHDWEDDLKKQISTPVTHAIALAIKKSNIKLKIKTIRSLVYTNIAPQTLTKINKLLDKVSKSIKKMENHQLRSCFEPEFQRLYNKVIAYNQEQKSIKKLSKTFSTKPLYPYPSTSTSTTIGR